jgi:hypothetical protein
MKVISILLKKEINPPGFVLNSSSTIGPAKHPDITKELTDVGVVLSKGGRHILVPFSNILYIEVEPIKTEGKK